jgi:hypothetical protein
MASNIKSEKGKNSLLKISLALQVLFPCFAKPSDWQWTKINNVLQQGATM